MTEATWGSDSKTPEINWTMSASLENVVRGGGDVVEVTNLAGAVKAWTELDTEHQTAAVLTPERPLLIDGASHASFEGEGIRVLVERLSA